MERLRLITQGVLGRHLRQFAVGANMNVMSALHGYKSRLLRPEVQKSPSKNQNFFIIDS